MRSVFLNEALIGTRLAAWAGFAALGAAAIRSDWREKRISHRLLAAGAAFCLLCYLVLGLHSLLGYRGEVSAYFTLPFYRDAVLHVAALGAAGLGLWYMALWPAGDAKLFLLLGLLYPLMSPGRSLQPSRLWFDVLVNIFIPAAAGVFLQALAYAWRTRLRHTGIFLRQMDLKMKLHYGLDLLRKAAGGAGRDSRAQLRQAWATARERPGRAALEAARLAAYVLGLSLASCAVQGLVSQPLPRTILCYAGCFVWQRVKTFIGPVTGSVLALAALAWLALSPSPGLRNALWANLRQITVFGFFFYFGVRWIRGLLAGQVGALAWPALGILASGLAGLFGALGIQGGMTLRDWTWTILAWAAMGAFFGVSLVLVRLREAEDHSSVKPGELKPYMLIHPDFVARLPADDPSGAFERWYADGLTSDQLARLQRWCRDRGVESVPLAKTMPFSQWIFLGYALTWLANGSVLRALAG